MLYLLPMYKYTLLNSLKLFQNITEFQMHCVHMLLMKKGLWRGLQPYKQKRDVCPCINIWKLKKNSNGKSLRVMQLWMKTSRMNSEIP